MPRNTSRFVRRIIENRDRYRENQRRFERYAEIYHRRTGRTLRRLPSINGLGRLAFQGEREPDVREFREHDVPHHLTDPPEYDEVPQYTRGEDPPEYTPGDNPDQYFTFGEFPNVPRIRYDMERINRNFNASLIQNWYRRNRGIRSLLPSENPQRFSKYRPTDEIYNRRYRYHYWNKWFEAILFLDEKTGEVVPGKLPRTRYGKKNFLTAVKNIRTMRRIEQDLKIGQLNIGWIKINNRRLWFDPLRFKENNKAVKGKHVIYYDYMNNRIGVTYVPNDEDFTYFPRTRDGERRPPNWYLRSKYWLGTLEDDFGINSNSNANLRIKVLNPRRYKLGTFNYIVDNTENNENYLDLDVWHKPNFEWKYLSRADTELALRGRLTEW